MNAPDSTTEAFLRYLRQEVDVLSGPIAEGCEHLPDCHGRSEVELIQSTLRSVADYFVRMSGAMTAPTDAFWSSIVQSFATRLGELEGAPAAERAGTSRPGQPDGPASPELTMLHAITTFDRKNDTSYLPRAKMFLWRFAAAFVAADMEGTINEESALDAFRSVLDAPDYASPDSSPSPS